MIVILIVMDNFFLHFGISHGNQLFLDSSSELFLTYLLLQGSQTIVFREFGEGFLTLFLFFSLGTTLELTSSSLIFDLVKDVGQDGDL